MVEQADTLGLNPSDFGRTGSSPVLGTKLTARQAGARTLVLCDTNGGTLPSDVGRITEEVIATGIPGDRLGIHTHDDIGLGVRQDLVGEHDRLRRLQVREPGRERLKMAGGLVGEGLSAFLTIAYRQ